MTGPGDGVAAAGGRGRLRASHADRERVISVLKAALVQGRLAKDELDARVSQTFAARTYAELAALTADLPAGLADIRPPHQPARAPARPAMSKVIAGAALVIPPAALLPPAFLTGNDKMGQNVPHPHVLLLHSLDDRRDRDARLMAPKAPPRATAATVRAARPGSRRRAGRRERR